MAKKKSQVEHGLDEYLKQLSNQAARSESKTSHVFLGFLNTTAGIPFDRIVPQGKSRRGLIDYLYFPVPRNTVVLFELKKLGTLRPDHATLSTQGHKYLYSSIKDLNLLDNLLGKRSDSERYLITTDLNTAYVAYRSCEHGKKTRSYTTGYERFNSFYEFCIHLKKDLGNASSLKKLKMTILLDDQRNRRDIVDFVLQNEKKRITKQFPPYKEFLRVMGRAGQGKGRWASRYKKALKAVVLKKGAERIPPNEVKAIRRVLALPKSFRLIKQHYQRNFHVLFKKTHMKEIALA